MNRQIHLNPVRRAVIVAIGAATTAGTASAQGGIEEIVVTATKRAELAQDIAIAVSTLGEEALEELNITNFQDYVRHLPGVTSGGTAPGRQDVFIRGVSTGQGNVKVAAAVLSEPNVAFYLDEAPISYAGRNLDVYMTDMSRVEVLPGPQGTLFGASSQAGTVRLITNKPVYNDFAAGFTASISDTYHGELSTSLEGYFNFPLIDDKLAARVALYSAKEGGFIDNVLGTKRIENPIVSALPEAERLLADNNSLAGKDFNDATFQGIRGGLKFAIGDEWEVLLQHMHQELDTEGVWDFDPLLGDLKTQTFSPDNAQDVWDHTAWTVTGRLASLDLIYTGSYLDRTVDYQQDYTGYSDAGPFMPYYLCTYPGYASCLAPNVSVDGFLNVERVNHEFRVTTDPERRVRLIAGVFTDDTDSIERGNWLYPATIQLGFATKTPHPTAVSSDPTVRGPGIAFFNDFTRGKEELSFFGELAFDITDSFTATIGARNYDIDISLTGSTNGGTYDGRFNGTNVTETLADQSPRSLSDTIYKVNLQWFATEDVMFYATWSEGYRPGAFNRDGGKSFVAGVPPFIPFFYESDELENIEFGWKTTLLDGSLQFNGSIYSLTWDRMQVSTIDFNISNLTFNQNAADSEIQGLEVDLIWAPTDELRLFANVSFNDTEITSVPATIVSISPVGSQLALAPELQYALRARYEWIGNTDYEPFAQVGLQFSDDTPSSLIIANQFQLADYTTFDASFGVRRDNWSATLFIENLTDERADIFIDNHDYIIRTTTNRPRTIGLRFSYDVGD